MRVCSAAVIKAYQRRAELHKDGADTRKRATCAKAARKLRPVLGMTDALSYTWRPLSALHCALAEQELRATALCHMNALSYAGTALTLRGAK